MGSSNEANHRKLSSICTTLILLVLSITHVKGDEGEEVWEKDWRLPEQVKPHLYDVRLEPLVEDSVFHGRVRIFLTSSSSQISSIVLHSKNLNITNLTLFNNGPAKLSPLDSAPTPTGQEVEVSEWFLYPKHEFLVVRTKKPLESGTEYMMETNFSGDLSNGRLNGFYTSRYTSQGKNKLMATTKFEPNHARLAFPCFDEPAMKAAFNIEIIKPSQDESVVSNMPQLKEEAYDKEKNNYLVRFEMSPMMSTYSLCWIQSDFQVVEEDKTSSGVLIRGLARNGHEGSMKFATTATKKSVEFFEQYLGVEYGLPKLDIIGVPDFSSGAMENWGMVTFRETNVMINPNSSGYMDYFSVVNVVCHEVAHMWFGNLVTMKWWDDIWLNEGFATYLSMKCSKALEPQLNVDEIGYVKKKLSALVSDTPLNTHPIVNPVSHNDQLSGVFDEIAYRKGHSLLEMFEDTLGSENFRRGLNSYLKKYERSVAETSNLIESLDEATERDVSGMMEDWTRQAGYPLLTVSRKDNKLVITQKRFSYKDKESNKQLSSCRWDIPIRYRTAEQPNKTQDLYFYKSNNSVELDVKNDTTWYKLNTGSVGFYRVNYPEDTWELYQHYLQEDHEMMKDWSDRANLLDDACSLARAGHLQYETALGLFTYLRNGKEENYAPWRVASLCLNDVKKRLPASGKTNEMFSSYIRNMIDASLQKTLKSVNKVKSSPFDYDAANEVIFSLACAFKHPDALAKSKEMFDIWLNQTEQINLDMKGVVFRYGVGGDNEESRWEKVWSLYNKVDDPHELRDLRVALISVKSSSLLKRLLEMSKNESVVRTQDYYAILSTMASKKKTNNIVWQLFRNDYNHLEDKFSGGKLSKLFQTVASNFYTKNKLKEVREFARAHPSVVPQEADQKKVEESIINNIKWRETHEKNIEVWLKRRNAQTQR